MHIFSVCLNKEEEWLTGCGQRVTEVKGVVIISPARGLATHPTPQRVLSAFLRRSGQVYIERRSPWRISEMVSRLLTQDRHADCQRVSSYF